VLVQALGPHRLRLSIPIIVACYLIPPFNLVVPAIGLKQLWKSALGPRDDSRPDSRELTLTTLWLALRLGGIVGTIITGINASGSMTMLRPRMDSIVMQRVMADAGRFALIDAGVIALYGVSVGLPAFIVIRIDGLLARRVRMEAD